MLQLDPTVYYYVVETSSRSLNSVILFELCLVCFNLHCQSFAVDRKKGKKEKKKKRKTDQIPHFLDAGSVLTL